MTVPTSVQLKLDMAQQHLQTLAHEIEEYLEPEPYKIVRNIQPSNQRLLLIEFHVTTEPDERLGVIIGDCLHNLRSALDHLACRLVEQSGGTVTKTTYFPILDKRRTDKSGKPQPPNIVGGVAPNVLALVGQLQPYTRGHDAANHSLSILRHLSNVDKHRLLHVVTSYLADAECALHFGGTILRSRPNARVIDHEAAIGAFEFPEHFDLSNMEVEAQGSAFVAIKEPGPWSEKPVVLVLEEIRQFIWEGVVARLHPFLQ